MHVLGGITNSGSESDLKDYNFQYLSDHTLYVYEVFRPGGKA